MRARDRLTRNARYSLSVRGEHGGAVRPRCGPRASGRENRGRTDSKGGKRDSRQQCQLSEEWPVRTEVSQSV